MEIQKYAKYNFEKLTFDLLCRFEILGNAKLYEANVWKNYYLSCYLNMNIKDMAILKYICI